jgi:hypothetical protein
MIMAVTGHTTAQMVSLYTRRASQKKRALRAVTNGNDRVLNLDGLANS